ncbi:MAG: sporulation protein YunB [Clostridia bacterium]|nr:sporulation protein YunB [Clostridia bacterium]
MARYLILSEAAKGPIIAQKGSKTKTHRPAGRALMVTGGAMALAALLFFWLLRPALAGIAEYYVRKLGIAAVNDSVAALINARADGFDMVQFMRDGEGRIIAVQSDTQRMTQLSTQAVSAVSNALEGLKNQSVYIPAGVLLGESNPFAAYGPKIPIRILPAGTVEAVFHSEFSGAGINQTRHLVVLRVKTTLKILLPAGQEQIDLCCDVPVSDTILLGQVPSFYLNGGN